MWSDSCCPAQVKSLFPGCVAPLMHYRCALCTDTAPGWCLRNPLSCAPPLAACSFPAAVPDGVWLCCLCWPRSFQQRFRTSCGGSWQRIFGRKYLGFTCAHPSQPHLPHYNLRSPSSIRKTNLIRCSICHFCVPLGEGTGFAVCCGQSEGNRACNEEVGTWKMYCTAGILAAAAQQPQVA